MARLRRGDLRGAEADARVVLESEEEPSLLAAVYSRAALCAVLIEQGGLEEADDVLAGVPQAAENASTHLGHHVADMRARLRLAQGRPMEALAELERCRIYEHDMGVCHGCWSAWRTKAVEAHLALDARPRAAALAAEALTQARRLGTPRPLGLALRAAGLAADRRERLDLLAQAADVFERGGVMVDRARVLADLGSALHEAGKDADARVTLERALELADSVGATVVAASARDALVALGARPRRREVTGAGALTPAERRVAELAAAGTSNREIAEGLFLTLKTVENHLTAAYRKLGISSRTQLADRLR
jgi:ATP/maltotriose-dependent transcriptional regulator MalT